MGALRRILCPSQYVLMQLLHLGLDSLVAFQGIGRVCSPLISVTQQRFWELAMSARTLEFTSLAAVCSPHSFSSDRRVFALAAASPDRAEWPRGEASAARRCPDRGELVVRVARSSRDPSRVSLWAQHGPRPCEEGGDCSPALNLIMQLNIRGGKGLRLVPASHLAL